MVEGLHRAEVYRHRAAQFAALARQELRPLRYEPLQRAASEWVELAAMADELVAARERAAALLRERTSDLAYRKLAPHRGRVLVLTESLEAGLAQLAAPGPLGNLDIGHQLGANPMVFSLAGGAIGERAGGRLDGLQPPQQVGRPSEACLDAAGVD
jgi:hypothetical protein